MLLGDHLATALVEQPRRVTGRQGPLAQQRASTLYEHVQLRRLGQSESRTRADLGDVQRGPTRRDRYDAAPMLSCSPAGTQASAGR